MNLNESPELVLIEIFKKLSLIDSIKCRRVCKIWKYYIDQKIIKNKEFSVFVDMPVDNKIFWYHNNQMINLSSSLVIHSDVIKNVSFLNFLGRLKVTKLLLHVYRLNPELLRLMICLINEFEDKLEHLQFDYFSICNYEETNYTKNQLKQKNLKSLDFYALSLPDFKFFDFYPYHTDTQFLDLQKLRVKILCLDELNYETIKNLKHLEVYSLLIKRNLKLRNLEFLFIYSLDSNDNISLNDFPSLKEFHTMIEEENIDKLNLLLKEKQDYKRKELKIFLQGFEYNEKNIRNKPFLSNFFHNGLSEEFLEYYEQNYFKFKIYPPKYCRLRFTLTDPFIRRFEKLNDLNKILNDHIEECYINSNFNYLKNSKLIFIKCKSIILEGIFEKESLNLLPKIFPNTDYIHFQLENEDSNEEIRLDFKFISEFKKIKRIYSAYSKITLNALKNILNSCPYFGRVSWKNLNLISVSADFSYCFLVLNDIVVNESKDLSLFLQHLEKEKILDNE